jgi:hypothetical protein
MKTRESAWRKAVKARLENREDLGKEGLHAAYFSHLPKESVFECLELIEMECDVPIGLLRPNDRWEKIMEPPHSKNPLRWMEWQVKSSDVQLELISKLESRLKTLGTGDSWNTIRTLDEYVRAWCGEERM